MRGRDGRTPGRRPRGAFAAKIALIDRELADLAIAEEGLDPQLRPLMSIPGLGLVTAATLLAGLPIERLDSPPQVAAYVGPCPRKRTSGSSLRGRSRTGPPGPAKVRRALDMPALVAIQANSTIRAFADRLRRAGKRLKVIVVAVMRKPLLLAWAPLRSGEPFSPTYREDWARART